MLSRNKQWLVLFLLVFLFSHQTAHPQEKDTSPSKSLIQKLQALDAKLIPKDQNPQSIVREHLREQLREVNKRETRNWRKCKTLADWKAYRANKLKLLRASMGNLPERPKNVKVITTKRIQGDGFQIHNILFESRSGLLVTANLYLPSKTKKSMPGIIISHSHHNPKTQGELQDMGMTWARLGCAVLVMDQVGYGERRQHPFESKKDYHKLFRVSRQDYYFRYMTGLQLYLIGDSLMSWMVNDLMRGVDVLLAQPNIDPQRIILMGAVAGGGDPCAVTAALDERISAAVPFNFGGPQPENRFPLPKDAEDQFNYAGSGSWESTRNLYLSARDGFLPWVIVGSIAPRGLIYAHEFAWDSERDPVWKRFQKIYQWHGQPKRLGGVKGRGSVRGRPPQSTHCNNIGSVHRQQIYPLLKEWFGIPAPKQEYRNRKSSSDLVCLTGKWKNKTKRVCDLAHAIGAKQITEYRKALKNQSAAQRRKTLQRDWAKLLGLSEELPRLGKKIKVTNRTNKALIGKVRHSTFMIHSRGNVPVPVELFVPGQGKPTRCPVVIALVEEGRRSFLKKRADVVAALLCKGLAVCVPDLRGTGETSSGSYRGRRSSTTSRSATALMLGEPMLGSRLFDLLAVIEVLQKEKKIDHGSIGLWADSFARVNSRNTNLAVPLGIDNRPPQCEPNSALLALLAAMYKPNVRAVYAKGGLASYLSILDGQFCYVPYDCVVPGVLQKGDVADVVGTLAPTAIRLEGFVDGQNRFVHYRRLRKVFEPALDAYRGKQKLSRLRISHRLSRPGEVAEWMARVIK